MSTWRLLPYQDRWLADRAPVKVAVKSRRIGLSWTEAYDAVMHAAEGSGAVTYSSYSKDMTAGWIGDCQDWAAGLHELALDVDEDLVEDGDAELRRYSLKFPSGKRIEALPSVPRALRSRGRPGDIAVIDEVAFTRDPDAMLQAAMALRVWGGRIRLISTHNGEQHPFNALVEDIRGGELPYSLHTITFDDAVAEGLYRRVLEVQAKAAKAANPKADLAEFGWTEEREAAWVAEIRASYRYPWQAEEELDCKPAPGGGTWITLEDYLACVHEQAGTPELYQGGPCWVGYDVARRRNLAVISVFEQLGKVLWLREMVVMHDEPFRAQRAEFARLMGDYRVVRAGVDQTGMGEVQVEELQHAHGTSRVEGIILSGPRRLDVATALRDLYEDNLIRVPKDRTLRDDVRSVRRAPGSAGAPRLFAEDRESDGHADRFWSLALAASVADLGEPRYELHRLRDRVGTPGPQRPGRRGDDFRWRHQPGGLA